MSFVVWQNGANVCNPRCAGDEPEHVVIDGTAPVHIVPQDDIYPHQDSITCPCGPRVEQYDRKLITHNAWDGRE